MKKIYLYSVIIAELVIFVRTNPITLSDNGQASTLQPPVQNTDDSKTNNYNGTASIEQLIKQQADTVRRIVTDQQQNTLKEHSTTVDKEKDEEKIELDKISLEDLKLKCQHFFKIYNSSKNSYDTNSHVPHNHRISTHRPYPSSNVRPVYKVPSRTASIKPPGFYITTEATTKKPTSITTTTKPVKQAIKYIRLEPVILQKTILNDGRTVYYWHHSLPSAAVNFPQQPPDFTMNQVFNSNTKTVEKPVSYRNNQKPSSDPNFPYHPNHLNFIHTTPSTTTAYSGLSIRDYFPFYWSNSNENTSPSTTSTTTTTTTTSTTQAPITTALPKEFKPAVTDPKDLILAQQLRFVVPVPYDNSGNDNKEGLDFSYYPNIPNSQTGTVSVQMPFVPAYHMIKAVAVPNNYQGQINYENIQNGNFENVQT